MWECGVGVHGKSDRVQGKMSQGKAMEKVEVLSFHGKCYAGWLQVTVSHRCQYRPYGMQHQKFAEQPID